MFRALHDPLLGIGRFSLAGSPAPVSTGNSMVKCSGQNQGKALVLVNFYKV
jgi:hypothetical protein